MDIVHITQCLADEEVDCLAGTHLHENCYDEIIDEDTDVYKPNGELLLKFRKGIIPLAICKQAYPSLRTGATKTYNRGTAGGNIKKDVKSNFVVAGNQTKGGYRVKKDGTLSNVWERPKPILSGLIGFTDKTSRMPYCRTTRWTNENPEKFALALPLIQFISKSFKELVPERYKAQKARCDKTIQDWVIPNSVFTTITINKNWQTAVHKDAGDLAEGFGCMTAFSAGGYKGCNLVFPKYRTAVNMRTGDLILCDVHEWHGNTPLVPKIGVPHERISCVFYYRENMYKCGTLQKELEDVKRRNTRDGTPLYI